MRDVSPMPIAKHRVRDDRAPNLAIANVELEQEFLGVLLIKNDILGSVSGFLKAEDFTEEFHRRIYSIASSMIAEGRVASPVTLKTFLGEHDIAGMTVPQYLARLIADAPAPASGLDYARAVHDLATRRALIDAARTIIAEATDTPVNMRPSLIASDAIAAVQAIAEAGSDSKTRVDPGEAATGVLDRARAIRAGEKLSAGVPSGLPDLDLRTGGFQGGELWVLGGRPGQGKTILATGFSRKVAERGARLISEGE
jgi:replicative DNA helicase